MVSRWTSEYVYGKFIFYWFQTRFKPGSDPVQTRFKPGSDPDADKIPVQTRFKPGLKPVREFSFNLVREQGWRGLPCRAVLLFGVQKYRDMKGYFFRFLPDGGRLRLIHSLFGINSRLHEECADLKIKGTYKS